MRLAESVVTTRNLVSCANPWKTIAVLIHSSRKSKTERNRADAFTCVFQRSFTITLTSRPRRITLGPNSCHGPRSPRFNKLRNLAAPVYFCRLWLHIGIERQSSTTHTKRDAIGGTSRCTIGWRSINIRFGNIRFGNIRFGNRRTRPCARRNVAIAR